MTIQVVGAYLGLSQDQEVFDYFRRNSAHFFPAMAQVDRSTFVRQAATLWAVKERLWYLIRDHLLLSDPTVALVESMPIGSGGGLKNWHIEFIKLKWPKMG